MPFTDPDGSPTSWEIPSLWMSSGNKVRFYIGWAWQEVEKPDQPVEGYAGKRRPCWSAHLLH